MNRISFVKLTLLAVGALSAFHGKSALGVPVPDGGTQFAARPNLLFVFTDDQRLDSIGRLNGGQSETPAMDALIDRGVLFENTWCMGSPHGAVCVPSRAMIFGGRGLFHTDMALKDTRTFPQILGEAGYETFATGKWHNGASSFERSFQRGRSVFLGGMGDHSQLAIRDLNDEGKLGEPRTSERFSSRCFADAAIEFLRERDDQRPFFCYVSFTAPHDPRMPPEGYAERYQDPFPPLPPNFLPQHPFDSGDMTVRDEVLAGWPREESVIRQQLAEYYGMITHVDEQIGRILEELANQGLSDNTIVVFAADHGLAMGSHGLLGKQSVYEHSLRAPLVIAGPGIEKGARLDDLVYLHDLNPTFCELASVAPDTGVEGKSLAPFLRGEAVPQWRKTLFAAYSRYGRAVRNARWKLIRWPYVNKTQLFDLDADPNEMVDVSTAPENAEVMADLFVQLTLWQKTSGDSQALWVDDAVEAAPVDLSDFQRKPDRWQPQWIVDKYFDSDR